MKKEEKPKKKKKMKKWQRPDNGLFLQMLNLLALSIYYFKNAFYHGSN